jgi:hypothetical protein
VGAVRRDPTINTDGGSIHILSYKDSSWKLGKDVSYTFTGESPNEVLPRQRSAKFIGSANPFQLKQAITEFKCSQLWLEIEIKNGRIQ